MRGAQEQIIGAIAGLALGWLAAPGINKTQGVRLVDTVVLGPWLVLLSAYPRLSHRQRAMLAFVGGATASYNFRNYLGYARD